MQRASVRLALILGLALVGDGLAVAAHADGAIPPVAGVTFSGHIEGGITLNPNPTSNPIDRQDRGNFGQLFTDYANQPRLNQVMLTAEHDIDPAAADYNLGFRLQGLYGTDARYTHFIGEGDQLTHSPIQWDVVEANLQAHLPWWSVSTDVKLGQYATPLGAETIDATQNQFYSHSYIFNFGLPLKHTGLLATTISTARSISGRASIPG